MRPKTQSKPASVLNNKSKNEQTATYTFYGLTAAVVVMLFGVWFCTTGIVIGTSTPAIPAEQELDPTEVVTNNDTSDVTNDVKESDEQESIETPSSTKSNNKKSDIVLASKKQAQTETIAKQPQDTSVPKTEQNRPDAEVAGQNKPEDNGSFQPIDPLKNPVNSGNLKPIPVHQETSPTSTESNNGTSGEDASITSAPSSNTE